MTNMPPEDDPVRRLIRERIASIGENLSSVSRRLGRNHAYLQQFLTRGVPKNLPEEKRKKLAPILGVEEQQLMGAELLAVWEPPNAYLSDQVKITKRIPAYGQAMTGKDGQFVLNGQKVADVLAPPIVHDVADAYAVVIAGTSMEPRYFAGEYVFVHPRLAVRKNDFVVVQLASDKGDERLAYVKQFVSSDSRKLRLMQFNPKKILEFPSNRVVSIHRIVMGGDAIL